MRRLAGIAIIVLGLVGSAARADAQPRRDGSATPAPRAGEPGAAPPGPAERRNLERREQIKKRIRAMRAYTLTEELALDEQTAGRLFPVLARYDDETDKLLERRVELQRRLRRADTMRDPRAIDRLIDDAVGNQRSFSELEDRRIADLRKILTPVQTAKLLIVLPALERKIETQLRKAITERAGRPGAPAAPAQADDDDDLQPDEVGPRPPVKRQPRRREAALAPFPRPGASNAPGNTLPCHPGSEPCR